MTSTSMHADNVPPELASAAVRALSAPSAELNDVGSALGGMLRLAGDDVLTVDDLLDGRLSSCRLAVASACQPGHYATADTPDEFTGLPAGFLQAGAACAVASLWQGPRRHHQSLHDPVLRAA